RASKEQMSARAQPWRVPPLPNGKAAGIQRTNERTGAAVARPAASEWKSGGHPKERKTGR
ncbi:MAG: hypothetical protein IKH30_14290, partial [Clostridia bacterium]|nr:hypothetical protein [Clostridia bacterium]